MKKKNSFLRLIKVILAELLIVAMVSYTFDIYYQYHEPFFGMAAVFNDRDNQMPGSIRNFDYDCVLAGSSVAENFDTAYIDEMYDCRTIKIIKSSGTMGELLYYLNMAKEGRDLQKIFWSFDIFSLEAEEEIGIFQQGTSRYLHTATALDDIPYLFNKEILLEKIPTWLASSIVGKNTGGNAYNWAEGKEFGTEAVVGRYGRVFIPEEDIISLNPEEYQPVIDANIERLKEFIENSGDTEFYFLFPPYSMLWWDYSYINGQMGMRIYELNKAFDLLTSEDNVKVYCFQSVEEIVMDLDNYMDAIHYSPEINQLMLEYLAEDHFMVTGSNYKDYVAGIEEMVSRIETEEIYKYFDLRVTVRPCCSVFDAANVCYIPKCGRFRKGWTVTPAVKVGEG